MVFKARLVEALEHHVLLERKVEHEAVLVAILGNVAHMLAAVADGGVGNILAAERDRAGGRLVKTCQAVDKLGLAVAVDTGDADDLACAHIEGNVVHGVALLHVGVDAEVVDLQDLARGLGLVLGDLKLHGAADHHVGKLLLGGLACVDGADVLTLAQNAHAVGDLHDLVELMGDEENGLAFAGKLLHRGHQFLDLLRSQNCGRLVEDEDLIVAVEHLQNLNALLHANGDILDLGVKVDIQTVAFGDLLDLLARLFLLQKAALCRLRAEDDVVEHGENVHQLEVLVHHADAKGGGVVRVLDGHDLAILFDDALFRLIKAEQNRHQGRFSRAVFTEERMDLTLFEL